MPAFLILAGFLAQAPLDLPTNDGWVTDRAGILSPGEESALEQELARYAQTSGHELSILTLVNLGGRPIEDLALGVARAWKIGRVDKNDGALLVIATTERQMRIEVGRGLEGTLTDSICGRIIREVISPRFQAREPYAGLSAGIKAMEAAIGGEPLPFRAPGARRGFPTGAVIFFVLMIVIAMSRRRGRGGPFSRSFGGPIFLPGNIGSRTFGRGSSWGGSSGGGSSSGGFGGFGGGGGFSGGGASGRW